MEPIPFLGCRKWIIVKLGYSLCRRKFLLAPEASRCGATMIVFYHARFSELAPKLSKCARKLHLHAFEKLHSSIMRETLFVQICDRNRVPASEFSDFCEICILKSMKMARLSGFGWMKVSEIVRNLLVNELKRSSSYVNWKESQILAGEWVKLWVE